MEVCPGTIKPNIQTSAISNKQEHQARLDVGRETETENNSMKLSIFFLVNKLIYNLFQLLIKIIENYSSIS